MSDNSHIFIVGLSRSGTTLARAVLNANSQIRIAAAESHFFGDHFAADAIRHPMRAPVDGSGLLESDENISKVLDIIYSPPEKRFWGARGIAR